MYHQLLATGILAVIIQASGIAKQPFYSNSDDIKSNIRLSCNVQQGLLEAIESGDKVGFMSLLNKYIPDLPRDEGYWIPIHNTLWKSSLTVASHMLKSLVKGDRCEQLGILQIFQKQLRRNAKKFVLYKNRLNYLKIYCIADEKTVQKIHRRIGQNQIQARKFVTSWIKLAKVTCPFWPFKNFFQSNQPLGITQMANVSAIYSNNRIAYVRPSIFPKKYFLPNKVQIIQDKNNNVTLVQQPLGRSAGPKRPPNKGTYGVKHQGLIRISHTDNVGIYVVKMSKPIQEEDTFTLELTCDSLWNDNEHCSDLKIPYPQDHLHNFVVVMGLKPSFERSKQQRVDLENLLKKCTLSTFDHCVRRWFRTLPCPKSRKAQKPVILASWIFYY